MVDEATASLVDIAPGAHDRRDLVRDRVAPVLLVIGAISGVTIFVLRRVGVRVGRRPGDAAAAG